MAIAFQFPGICIDLGRGVGQCLHYHMERKMHKVLASVLGRQQWLIMQVSGKPAGETSWRRNPVLSVPATETLLNELCSARTPAFLFWAFDPSHWLFSPPTTTLHWTVSFMFGNIPQWPCWSLSLARYDGRRDYEIFNCKILFATWDQRNQVLTPGGPAVFHLPSFALCRCEARQLGSRWDASSSMLRTSSSYSLLSSLAWPKLRGWNGPLSDVFSMHAEPHVLAHFRNINQSTKWTILYLLYQEVERSWHSHQGEEEFRDSENQLSVTWYPAGDILPAWLLVWTTWATPSGVRRILKQLVSAIWSGQQTTWGLQLCVLLSLSVAGHASLLAALKVIKLWRIPKLYCVDKACNILAQIRANYHRRW